MTARSASRNPLGRHPLHRAAVDGQNEVLRELLAGGAPVDVVDSRDFTPLHFAAQQGNSEGVRILLEAGADPSLRNELGNDALRTAIQNTRDVEAVLTLLMEHGADPHVPNNAQSTVADVVRLTGRQDLAAIVGVELSP